MGRIAALVCLLLFTATSVGAGERICGNCGEEIKGPHFETAGKYYHPDHFRCDYCNRSIDGAYTDYKEKSYHRECFREGVALRCSLCGGIISGEYILDYWGNSYHKHHKSDAPSCDSCSRFIAENITGGGVRYDDGRYICEICHKTSVTSIDEIVRLVEQVARQMATFGMGPDFKGMNVHLIGRDEMQKLAGQHSAGLRGFTDYSEKWRFFGRASGRKLDIYFLYGMPRRELISTIAHELAHVWQFNHGRFQNDRKLREGSCNYAAFLVLGHYPGQKSAFFRSTMLNDPDERYGDGFRRVKVFAEAEGTKVWLDHLRKEDGFPHQY